MRNTVLALALLAISACGKLATAPESVRSPCAAHTDTTFVNGVPVVATIRGC